MAASTGYLADGTLTVGSTAQVHAFVSSIFLLGESEGRTGWPARFADLGVRFTALRLNRVKLGVDEMFTGAIATLLGLGFSDSDCTNILSGYAYDLVKRVAQSLEPGKARTIAVGHLEWLSTMLTRQASTEYRVAPQALGLLAGLAGNPNAALGASGASGSPDASDGLLTRGAYNWGRFAEASEAGRSSWYASRTTTDKVSGPGVSASTTSTTTPRAPAPPPPGK